MSRWDLFELNHNKEVVPFADSHLKVTPFIEEALKIAANSKVPNPKFSQYYVKCSCVVVDTTTNSEVFSLTTTVPGGNIEYGLCQALHGEESLVAAVSSKLNGLEKIEDKHRYVVYIAFCSKFETGKIPTCCGNCRDIMRDAFPPNTLIFGGHPSGGKVIISHLSDLLVDSYNPINIGLHRSCTNALEATVLAGPFLENDIYSPDKPNSRRKYYAGIIGQGTAFFGAHDVMCDYHPIYAIRDAVRQARRANTPSFNYVIVASPEDGSGLPPDVMYKDRQHLMELNFQQECIRNQKIDPPIFLVNYKLGEGDEKIKIVSLWRTTVKDWLPYAFSPAAFGEEFIKYATQKFNKK